MIIEPKSATIAYRCPSCGGVPTSIVGIFNLSGDLFKLKCSCGGSELTVSKLPNDMFNITLPCITCSYPHSFEISRRVLFDSDIFIKPCGLSGFDICFIGKEDKVSEQIKRSNEEISKVLSDYAIENLKFDEHKEKLLSDPAVLDIVTFVISDMAEEGAIHCDCSDGQGHYVCDINDGGVDIVCKNCSCSAHVPTHSTIAAYEFLNSDSLTLKKS